MNLPRPVAPFPGREDTRYIACTISSLHIDARSQHVVPSLFATVGSAPQSINASAASGAANRWVFEQALRDAIQIAVEQVTLEVVAGDAGVGRRRENPSDSKSYGASAPAASPPSEGSCLRPNAKRAEGREG